MSVFSKDHIPVYSTPFTEVAGTVMLVHSSTGQISLFDASTRKLIRPLPLGDTNGPRLHPLGHIYYTVGHKLRWEQVDGRDGETLWSFDSPVTIGGNEGDFDPSGRYLPIVRGEYAGIFDVVLFKYTEAHVGPGIDWAMVGGSSTLAVGRGYNPSRIESYQLRDGKLHRSVDLAPASGHSDVAVVNGVPMLVTTTSDWRSHWPRGGGTEEWLVAVHMETGQVAPIRQTGWRAQHIACWQDWILNSFHTAGDDPSVQPSGEIWIGRAMGGGKGHVVAVAEGAAPVPYTAQPHASWAANGARIYFGEKGGTRVVDVSGFTGGGDISPPPPPPPRPRNCWDHVKRLWRG